MRVLINGVEQGVYPDCPEHFPDELLNEEWAQEIHSQTLAKLNSRGGLHPCEIVVNVNRIPRITYSNSIELQNTVVAIRRIKQYILNHSK